MKPRCYLVALLLVACCSPLCVFNTPSSSARGNAPSGVSQAQESRLRRLRTEGEFRALLRADRVVILFWPSFSVFRHHAMAVVTAWVRDSQPDCWVVWVDAHNQPYVLSWLEKKKRGDLADDKRGAVAWLRRGAIVADTCWPADWFTQAQLRLLTERVFNRDR